MGQLVLASSSPRRQSLLKQVNIPFILRKQDVDESIITTQNPTEAVKQLAVLKGESVSLHDNEVILTADTVVSFQGSIFGKPQNKDDAFDMLTKLSGNIHEVYTGVMIRSENNKTVFIEKTEVEFWDLNEQEIMDYISTRDPFDKAGSYGIQSRGALLVKRIIGDYFNVVGLPIGRLVRELKKYSIYPK
ncbi:septum formation protein [Salirhabdus euzebyi]|uniref:dTTP/UTP pyrophosphatase n=1 Tax=Salirhabdus euzebyi TaxID=394506 RepID=A0A841Q1B7_9BACI|nr:Maf family protein [Salirhabdus euzebyi]MBB6451923.1 septum formation protein [Salirhabdus euzebyi]